MRLGCCLEIAICGVFPGFAVGCSSTANDSPDSADDPSALQTGRFEAKGNQEMHATPLPYL